jgi:ATP-dependent Clp protease ATP-binding subunit ClpC
VAGELTVCARRVFECARDEAAAMKHHYIGTEHLVLGLLRESEGVASRVLTVVGVDVELIRRDVTRMIVGLGDEPVGVDEELPLTPRMENIAELANAEAETRGQPLTDTEHLLLGLVREGKGVANVILADLGVDGETIRRETDRFLPGQSGGTSGSAK